MPRVATIDIGTNTLLLLVLEQVGDGSVEVVDDRVRFGRLGKGLDATGRLDPSSVEASLAAVRDYRERLDELGVSQVRAVGTQALREAANAAEFTGPASEILGTAVETIAGEREAELVHRSVTVQFPELAAGDLVIADVGGGSTEIIVARGGTVAWYRSLPIGSVRMTERHLTSDPPTPEQTAAAAADIDALLSDLDVPEGVTLIGTAGTATTVAAIDLRLARYARQRVHGHALPPVQLDRLLASLLELSVAERKRLPGLEPERADVIAGGALIFSRLCNAVRAPRFLVADCGVRWGLAYELLGV